MNKNHYIHNSMRGMTIQFSDQNGMVEMTYQMTLDPNEECNSDIMSVKEARTQWKNYIKEGFKKSHGWHTCKRGMELEYNDD